jgi:transposase, IS5 family
MQGKNGQNAEKSSRKPASHTHYVSPNQLVLPGFESPFEQKLSKDNRWVKLSYLIPWDSIVSKYNKLFKKREGRPLINGRIIIGAVIIKHTLNLSDEETIFQIQENVFMQYLLGYSSFTNEIPFDASLFVEIRKRLDSSFMDQISLLCLQYNNVLPKQKESNAQIVNNENDDPPKDNIDNAPQNPIVNKGTLMMDATVCPQDITFPTDLKLLDSARRKSEQIIDKLHIKDIGVKIKPRTYRELARRDFLNTSKKKRPSYKILYKAIGSQIRYLKRNLDIIKVQVDSFKEVKLPLKAKDLIYIQTIQLVLEQQNQMHATGQKSIPGRIVNIHQPHVRPIKRGKAGKSTEFGSKIQISLYNGFTFIDKLSWDNFNESQCLQSSVQEYKKKFGYYPARVLVDKIYSTRENRTYLNSLNIELSARPLGRPSKNEALSNQISPGERNPVEGKFGQAKRAYGMERVRAKLRETSESWISSIIMVLNLVKLTRKASLCLRHNVRKLYTLVWGMPEKIGFFELARV